MTIKMTLAAAALALSAPAFAAETDLGTSVVYGDLDLASAKGAAQLERRVKRAATQACGVIPVINLNARETAMACHSGFIAEAHAKLEPAFAAIAAAKARGTTLAAR